MKILFITDLYPVKSDERSTPRTLCDFVVEWKKQGCSVDVIKPNFILNSFLRKKPFYKTGKYYDVINVNYWTPFWFDVKSKIKKFNLDLSSYDIIISHMPSGTLFADKLGLPFVSCIHNSDIEVLTKPIYVYFAKRLKRALYNAQKVACRSHVIQKKFINLFDDLKNRTFVASSGIDLDLLKNNKQSKVKRGLCECDVIKVLTCAHFKKRKNIDKVINACKELQGFSLTVIGDGKERKTLEKLDKNTKFTGYLKHDEVLEYMRDSDIFILPSINETFGMVYLEAMTSGCITVCSENDGISGIIKNGYNGYLVKPDVESIKKLFLELKNLSATDAENIRNNAFDTVKIYNKQDCAKIYLQQIFNIL